jgi:hypothetical protein
MRMKPATRLRERYCSGRALAALLLCVATASSWSQEPAKPATGPAPAATEQKSEPAPATEKAPAGAETPAATAATPADAEQPAEGTEKAPERFIPKEKASADNSATFPIDI